MRPLFLLTKKNLKLLLRAKGSALIVVFAPLLLMLILGLSYDSSSTYGLNIGIFSPTIDSADAHTFISTLQKDNFKIVTYDKSIEECVSDLKSGFVHACIKLPESLQIRQGEQKEVVFYLDPSKINLVWMIQETVKSEFNLKSQELSQELTNNMLTVFSDTKNVLGTKRTELQSIGEKNTAASASIISVKTGLAEADVQPVDASYDDSALIQLSGALNSAKKAINDAQQGIDALEEEGTSVGSVAADLDSAAKKIDNALANVNGSGNGNLADMIAGLKMQLNTAYNKMTALDTVIKDANGNLDNTASALQEGKSAIDNVVSSLSDLEAKLAAQSSVSAEAIVSPLTTKIEKVGEADSLLNYLFPTLLIIVIMFISILLGTTLVMMEKNSPAFIRNFFLPLRKPTFIIATYLTNLVLIIVQVAVILLVSFFFLRELLVSLPLMFLVLVISASIFIFLGMAIGYLFTSEETGVLGAISLGSLLLLISGVILPLESISPLMRQITSFNPFVISEKIVREVFIFKAGFYDVMIDLLILVGYTIALFIIILIAENVLHKHLVERFMRHHHKLHRQSDKINKNDV